MMDKKIPPSFSQGQFSTDGWIGDVIDGLDITRPGARRLKTTFHFLTLLERLL